MTFLQVVCGRYARLSTTKVLNPKKSCDSKNLLHTTKQFPEWNWKHSIKRRGATFSPPTFINPPRRSLFISGPVSVFWRAHTNPPLVFAILCFSSCSPSVSPPCFTKWSCVRSCLHGTRRPLAIGISVTSMNNGQKRKFHFKVVWVPTWHCSVLRSGGFQRWCLH